MTDPDREIWDGMLAHLRRHHPALCRHWFEDLRPITVAEGSVFLRTDNEHHRDYLRRSCVDAFVDAAQVASNSLLGVRFLGPGEDDPQPTRTPGRSAHQSSNQSKNQSTQAGGSRDVRTAAHEKHEKHEQADRSAEHGSRVAGAEEPRGAARPSMNAPAPAHTTPRSLDPNRQGPLHLKRDGYRVREAEAAAKAIGGTGVGGGASGGSGTRSQFGSSEVSRGAAGAFFLNPDHTFDNFVMGEGNRWAYSAAIAVAENPGRSYNPLFIHGDVGLGKTHLLQAICLQIRADRPDAVLHYVSCDEFINEFMQSVQNNQMGEFRHRFRDVDVLVIDDIHFLTSRERSQEEFFHTFNSLHQTQRQIIISSDAPPSQIPNLESRLVSRFQSGLVAEIERPTFETRVAILMTKARLRGIELGPGVAEFVASRFTTNIRELEGAITQLQVFASMDGSAITLDIARKAFGERIKETKPQPSIEDIIRVVCDYFDVKRVDLLGKRRHQSVSLPRQVCMFLVRRNTRLSLAEIGTQFGGRDHSTVIHAVNSVEAKQTQDESFATMLLTLESQAISASGHN